MKNFKYLFTKLTLILGVFFMGCSEDVVEPAFQEMRNQSFDLVVVSEENQHVPVSFAVAAPDLERVTVELMKQGTTTVLATNTLKSLSYDKLNRVNMTVPFPTNDKAPSGFYTVQYTTVSKNGQQSVGTYDINVINNVSPVLCNFTKNLPTGKTVWLRLYVPEGASLPATDNTIYVTGSFGSREGGADWDGGGGPHKFTRISPSCYELAMNFVAGDQFKITRGTWDKQMATEGGAEYGNFVYNGETTILKTAWNWRDRTTVVPSAPAVEILKIPAEAVMPGMMTIVASLAESMDPKAGDYYVVEKGATNLTGAVKMVAFEEGKMVAAAVAKKTGVEYVVVKGVATATGRNSYGFLQSATWNGKTNPVRVNVGTFGPPAFALGNKIVIVGGATPGDWGVSSGQDFTKTADGKYSITLALKANSEYLLLPDYGQWDKKWAFGSGNASKGAFDVQGSGNNFNTNGLTAGNYRIDVDFTTGNGIYTLTKL